MLAEEKAREVVEKVLEVARKAGAEAAEVHLGGGLQALTRFASNEIHQNVESSSADLALRVVVGKRTARTSTTRLDATGLEELVKRTIEVARLTPEDPGLLPMLSASDVSGEAATRVVAKDTAECTPGRRAELVGKVLEAVKKAGFEAAGYLSTGRGSEREWGPGTWLYGNSRGLRRSFERTSAAFSLTVQGKDSSGWCEAQSPELGAIPIDALAARTIEKCRASANPADVDPGAWDVVLEPAAVKELTDFLTWGGFSGRGYEEGDQWSSGLMGKKVFGENITIRDDHSDKRNPQAPFDEEGHPRSKLLLVEKGVLAGLAWDRRSAKKAGTIPTGHGWRVPNLEGGGPANPIVDGGTGSLEEMIKSTKRGILVTRFWYNRLVDKKKVIVTGMTRDGTFLIEDGKIARGIKNMRFNQGIIEMLNRVVALGPVDPSFLVPAMKVSGFTFSSKTRF